MFDLLNQPYPYDDSLPRHLRKAVLIGLFVGLFLLVFQPFGLDDWPTSNKALKLMGFGVVASFVTGFNQTVWSRLFPRLFAEERWTVGREIVFVTLNIVSIAVANRLYLGWLFNGSEEKIPGWIGIIVFTFLIGIFPVMGLVLFRYISQLRKYSRQAAELPVAVSPTGYSNPPTKESERADTLIESVIKLIADNEKDTIALPAETLLFIESSDNYCTVMYLKNSQVVKPLLRSSLGRLESQITEQPSLRAHIVRCHRSYIVNLNRVERVTGNAQGYKLHLSDGQFVIPVARKYNDTLVAELKAL